MAIEITAAGIEVENVSPALSPKYTFAAVNTSVIMMPMMRPRTGEFFAHRTRRIVCNHRRGQGIAINTAGLVPDSAENGAVGNRDMAGGLGSRPGRSAVAVERCGKQPRDN